jgi:23S rRNA (uracil1939-C5)-methyltransferase
MRPDLAARPEGCEERCPACPQRDLTREESEIRNNAWLEHELKDWRGELSPILSPSIRWGYRRKVLLHARLLGAEWHFGMIRMRGWEEEFIPIPLCPLHHPSVNKALAHLAPLLPELPLVYVLISGRALTLVVKAERKEEWVTVFRQWEKGWPLSSLWVNWHPGAGKRAIDSRRNERIFGEEWIEERGLIHGPSAFRQQIPELEEQALAWATDWLGQGNVAVDFYSGLGASLARWVSGGWMRSGWSFRESRWRPPAKTRWARRSCGGARKIGCRRSPNT